MSLINSISVHSHCNDLGGQVWNPSITWTKKYAVFISITSEHGITGVGECWCFDTTPDVLIAYLKTEICPLVVGSNTSQCKTLYQRLLSSATLTARHGLLASAWSGIDIALWDMQSRMAGLPLWKFLTPDGPEHNPANGSVQLYASGGLYSEHKTIDKLTNEMTSMNSSGFNIVKMKIGGLSIDQDLARVTAVLSALKHSCKLIIDGVYSYSVAQALEIFSALPTDRIEAFQSPISADNLCGMKQLCDAGVPVMGIEAEYRHEIHQHLVHCGAVKFLQTAAIACGGISRLQQLSDLVAQPNSSRQKLSLEVSSTAVALLAAAHYGAACNSIAHVEYHYLHQVYFEKLNFTPVKNQHGWFQLPNTPGLGIELSNCETQMEFTQSISQNDAH